MAGIPKEFSVHKGLVFLHNENWFSSLFQSMGSSQNKFLVKVGNLAQPNLLGPTVVIIMMIMSMTCGGSPPSDDVDYDYNDDDDDRH